MIESLDAGGVPQENLFMPMEFVGLNEKIGIFVAWPYANGPRHLGHGASLIPGDVLSRYYRSMGADVMMVSGTDEYGTPNAIAAESAHIDPYTYVTSTNEQIRDDFIGLGMSFDWFTRTTTDKHAEYSQEVFASLVEHGYIQKGEMLGAFDSLTDQALPDRYVEGGCPHCSAQSRGDQCEECTTLLDPSDLLNPVSKITGNNVEFRNVEHYFLMLDKLAPALGQWLDGHKSLRANAKTVSQEMAKQLRPRAITRDMEWGVPLPAGYELGDKKVMYVWFEAVIGYVSASIEWARECRDQNGEAWKQWWFNDDAEHYYVMGKDNVPFHTIVWPAIIKGLQNAGYEGMHMPDNIASTEYLMFKEGKLSSSRGNTVYVTDMLSLVGPDALRYYLLSAGPETSDVAFSFDQLTRRVNDELIAKWGNLVGRTFNLIRKNHQGTIPSIDLTSLSDIDVELLESIKGGYASIGGLLESSKFSQALKQFMMLAGKVNKYLYDAEPWKTVKQDKDAADRALYVTVTSIQNLATMAAPFMPHSSQVVYERLGFEGNLASQPHNAVSAYGQDIHVLTGDYEDNKSRWYFTIAPMGQQLSAETSHLFQKLDEEKLILDFEAIALKRQVGKSALL